MKYLKSTFEGELAYRSTKRDYKVAMWAKIPLADGRIRVDHLSFNSKPLTKGSALKWYYKDSAYDYAGIKVFAMPVEEVTKEEFDNRDELIKKAWEAKNEIN
tara:strand:- start:309 stop:614 length:306 start_codon:yes stop_codon:yes gene_type:complete